MLAYIVRRTEPWRTAQRKSKGDFFVFTMLFQAEHQHRFMFESHFALPFAEIKMGYPTEIGF